MTKHEEYRNIFQQDVEVPEKVWSQFEKTLENIEDLASERREERCMVMKKKKTGRAWIKAAVVVGAITAGGGIFCYNNPAAASQIPIIGNIFEQVEHDATYSGDYVRKEVLEDNKNNEVSENTNDKKSQNSVYTAENKGITITASEVYCDGYSVYLTAKIESEKGGIQNIPESYTRRFEEKTSKMISTIGTWEVNDSGEEAFPSSIDFEGKAVDDHTFVGMLKIDLKEYSQEDGMLKLKFSDFWYDNETDLYAESIEPSNRFTGKWKLVVPYSVDKEQCKEILVNKKNKQGFGIEKVFVSPYQVIVFTEVPYTTLSSDTYTQEDFERQWGKKNEEIIAQGDEPVTYDSQLAKKYYEYCELAAYNQDNESLEWQYGDDTKAVFAVQEKKLEKLHIYMGDESHEMELLKAENQQDAKEKSMFDVEVDLN